MFFYYYDEEKDTTVPMELDDSKLNTVDFEFFNDGIRKVWNLQEEEWYFSIVDIVQYLTDSTDPKQYIKKMRIRDPELNSNWGTICTLVPMKGADGKQRRTMAATTQGMFRIIQSIPSPKAEPFKQWMAQVAADRLDQMQDPELSIQQAMVDYKRLGYSDNWINQRLKAIEVRKDLTDAWKKRGVQEGQQFATLTDIITNAWSGFTTREYKAYKGLRKENLRDNMTNTELILNMLAEASTKDITEATDPRTLAAHKAVARQGGTIARNARLELEARTGRKVVSPLNAHQVLQIEKTDEAELQAEDEE